MSIAKEEAPEEAADQTVRAATQEEIAALPIPRESAQMYPGRYVPEFGAAQKQRPPPKPKTQRFPGVRAVAHSVRESFGTYAEMQAKAAAKELELREVERQELKDFERKVKLTERKRLLLARATAKVEAERDLAYRKFKQGGQLNQLTKAIIKRIEPTTVVRRQRITPSLQPDVEYQIEPEAESGSGLPPGYGRFGTLHFALGQPKGNTLHWSTGKSQAPGHRRNAPHWPEYHWDIGNETEVERRISE